MNPLQYDSPAVPFLILAHPGHELRLFHWMERRRPRVFLLTDGSGGAALPRTHYSAATLATAGATAGGVFGGRSDKAWYAALLAGDPAPFAEALDRIAAEAERLKPELLVTDAVDGYNPMHDLCAALGTALRRRLAAAGHFVQHMVSLAVESDDPPPLAELLHLDPDAVLRKQRAVAAYTPLADEVRSLLAARPEALHVELLQQPDFAWSPDWTPRWETIGRERVATGRYTDAISYARHVRPIALSLGAAAGATGREGQRYRHPRHDPGA